MKWEKYYDKVFAEWSVEKMVSQISFLENIGSEQEVMDVLYEIGYEDKEGASRLVEKALRYGMGFSAMNLGEISELCNGATFLKALEQVVPKLTAKELEELQCYVDEELLLKLAKKHNRPLPESLRCMDPEVLAREELKFDIELAVESADYALQCLYQAQSAMNVGSSASLIDMLSGKRWASVYKYLALGEAEQALRIASDAVSKLNYNLSCISRSRYVKLHYVKLASIISLWFDDNFLNCLIHLQIGKVQKKICRAILQVENIRRELAKLWEKL